MGYCFTFMYLLADIPCVNNANFKILLVKIKVIYSKKYVDWVNWWYYGQCNGEGGFLCASGSCITKQTL